MDNSTVTSKVVHLRNVPPNVTRQEFQKLAQPFGNVTYHVVMRNKRQALVEFESARVAQAFVFHYTNMPCRLGDHVMQVQFSDHQELNRAPPTTTTSNSDNPPHTHRPSAPHLRSAPRNFILLVTIHECRYPITTDVIHQVFSMYGTVDKAVVFSNRGGNTQALVQYRTVDAAQQALELLQGQNVYPGACRLDVQYSKHTNLTVTRNNERTRDFNNPNLPSDAPALLPTPDQSVGGGNAGGAGGGGGGGGGGAHHSLPQSTSLYERPPYHTNRPSQIQQQQPQHHVQQQQHQPVQGFPPPPSRVPQYSGANALQQHPTPHPTHHSTQHAPPTEESVLLLSNLHPDKTNCQTVFNLFSNYGNVVRVKRFYNKPDSALIQMASPIHAQNALQYLKDAVVFGKAMRVTRSRHGYIKPGPNPITNPSLEEAQTNLSVGFINSKFNRFRDNPSKGVNRMYPPSATLHLSNLSDEIVEESVREFFSPHGKLVNIKMFEASDRTMAWVQFETQEDATDVISLLNNVELCGRPVRLAFSRSAVTV